MVKPGDVCPNCNRVHPLSSGDSVYVSRDGVYVCIDLERLAAKLKEPDTARELARLLLASAKKRGRY